MNLTLRMVCAAFPLLVALGAQPQPASPANLLASRISAGLARVRWDTAYQVSHGAAGACQPVGVHPDLRGGLYDYAEHCTVTAAGVVAESFYYPVGGAAPAVLLRRASFRISDLDPELNAKVEQLLKDGLTRRYGAGDAPDGLFEIGAQRPNPGLRWRAGSVTIFLHHNRTYVEPVGIRQGVQLIAVRREVLDGREEQLKVAEALGSSTALSKPALAAGLAKELGDLYLAPHAGFPKSEAERSSWERRTRAALLRLLSQTSEGERDRRAAVLVAADDLAVRLGALLISREIRNGSEILTEVPEAVLARRQLARYRIVFTGPGHYSGDLEYDRSLLIRAWKTFPETQWGQRAFLMTQKLSCQLGPRFGCKGPGCFREVIRQGEEFLLRYPRTELRKEQTFHLALAYETWWSLSRAKPDDPTAEGANVDQAGAETARQRAIALYEELARIAPGSPEARVGLLRMPRLKLGLATGERTFFCFSC